MTIITIAKAPGYTYRETETPARDLRDVLKIKKVTTFQNLHAFAKKVRLREIQDIIEAIAIIVPKNRMRELGILIDSTGFQIMHVVMDEETRVIILATLSDRYCNDSEPLWNYFLPELEKIAKVFGFMIRYVSADSAYASNGAYKEVKESPNAIPVSRPVSGEEFRGGASWLLIG